MATRYERLSQRKYAERLGLSNTAVSKAIKQGRIVNGVDHKTGEIIVPIADQEWGLLHRKTDVTAVLEQQEPPTSPQEELPGHELPRRKVSLSEDTPFAEAKRINEIVRAQMATLDLQERKGELLRKDAVQKELFLYGQTLRKALERIPERVIDSIRAAASRNEGLQLLEDEIYAVLDELTRIQAQALEQKKEG